MFMQTFACYEFGNKII